MKCVIVANGRIENPKVFLEILKKADFIICADGGANHLLNLDIKADVIIGDLDSISSDAKKHFEKFSKFISFNKDKDYTDTEIAIDYAVKMKANKIDLLGSLGSRFDHSLCNVLLLHKLANLDVEARIIDEKNTIYFLNEKINKIKIKGDSKANLSLIPLSKKVEGVSLEGVKYLLSDYTLDFASSRGISNVFVEDFAKVKIKKGRLLVIKSQD